MLVNGEEMDFAADTTISELLQQLNLNADRIVVAVNMNIIRREEYTMILTAEDQVELISMVGGG